MPDPKGMLGALILIIVFLPGAIITLKGMMMKTVDENTTEEEAERLFRRAKNARRQQRRDEAAARPEPEPEKPELADIVGELLDVIDRMVADQPIYHRALEKIREDLNELRYT